MGVYVDTGRRPFKGMIMCHLMADTEAELHAMADKIGCHREWYQADASTPHYDLPVFRRQAAITLGATVIDRKQTVALIRKIRTNPAGFYQGLADASDENSLCVDSTRKNHAPASFFLAKEFL